MKIYAIVFIVTSLTGMKQGEIHSKLDKQPLKELRPGMEIIDKDRDGLIEKLDKHKVEQLEKEIEYQLRKLKRNRTKKNKDKRKVKSN